MNRKGTKPMAEGKPGAAALSNTQLADRLKMAAALDPFLQGVQSGAQQARGSTLQTGHRQPGGPVTPGQAGAAREAPRGGGFRTSTGYDLSGVAAHSGGQAAQAANSLGAAAFSSGGHATFGSGTFNPGSHAGQALVAHELAHVMQQGRTGGGRGAGSR
ncbi:DUF4157 domain-containing protein [Rhodospira trueperi]|uniref:eCIS core domain-containing protein n=1 Tax=Rhodospira trueperi TaxID=69960 RepID=A0A1G7FI05_9PROT|nr:DUF4157 domain-containing protein [Rhodospira trueperi]SDE75175.1 protein of unknown function [Rhodospira trueperi]